MSEEVKKEEVEVSPLAAIQAEYGQLVGQLGHNLMQKDNLDIEEKQLRDRLRKLITKSQNIPQPKKEA